MKLQDILASKDAKALFALSALKRNPKVNKEAAWQAAAKVKESK